MERYSIERGTQLVVVPSGTVKGGLLTPETITTVKRAIRIVSTFEGQSFTVMLVFADANCSELMEKCARDAGATVKIIVPGPSDNAVTRESGIRFVNKVKALHNARNPIYV